MALDPYVFSIILIVDYPCPRLEPEGISLSPVSQLFVLTPTALLSAALPPIMCQSPLLSREETNAY